MIDPNDPLFLLYCAMFGQHGYSRPEHALSHARKALTYYEAQTGEPCFRGKPKRPRKKRSTKKKESPK